MKLICVYTGHLMSVVEYHVDNTLTLEAIAHNINISAPCNACMRPLKICSVFKLYFH